MRRRDKAREGGKVRVKRVGEVEEHQEKRHHEHNFCVNATWFW